MANKSKGPYRGKIYTKWKNMKARCYVEKKDNYKYYGGRGIKICDEWLNSFDTFYDWAISNGYKDGLTIDRINSDGNYEPSNCRWADKWEQAINKRKRSNNKSGYVNVLYNKEHDKWEAKINMHNKRTFLGRYETQKEALEVLNKYIKDHNLPHKIQEYVGELCIKTKEQEELIKTMEAKEMAETKSERTLKDFIDDYCWNHKITKKSISEKLGMSISNFGNMLCRYGRVYEDFAERFCEKYELSEEEKADLIDVFSRADKTHIRIDKNRKRECLVFVSNVEDNKIALDLVKELCSVVADFDIDDLSALAKLIKKHKDVKQNTAG